MLFRVRERQAVHLLAVLPAAKHRRSVCEHELQVVGLVGGLEELLCARRRRAGRRGVLEVVFDGVLKIVELLGKRLFYYVWVVHHRRGPHGAGPRGRKSARGSSEMCSAAPPCRAPDIGHEAEK